MMQVSSLLIAPNVLLSSSLLKCIGNFSILCDFISLFIYSIAAAFLVALLKSFKNVKQMNSPGPTSASAFKLFLVNLFEAFVGALSTPLFLYLFFEDLLPKFNKAGIETTVIFAIMMGTAWTGMELLEGLKSLFLQIKDLSLGQWIKTKSTPSADLKRFAVKDLITPVAMNERSLTEGIQASKLNQILRACRLRGGKFSLADIKLITELNEAELPYLVNVLEVNGFLASGESKDGVEFFTLTQRGSSTEITSE